METTPVRAAGLLVMLLAMGAAPALAADVPTSYLVELDPIRRAVAGTPVTIELHADPACSTPVHASVLAVEDISLIERIRTVRIRGTGSSPRVARLHHVVAGAPAASYVKIVGVPIVPVGGACQAQRSEAASPIPCASQVGTEVYFTGCNVNVRSGAGQSDALPNGLGNLVIGYNETDGTEARSGSHNLIVGPDHSYSSVVGMAVGLAHTLEGSFASVSGGAGNTAAGFGSAVSGGLGNDAGKDVENPPDTAVGASVCGGHGNNASGDFSSIVGGGFSYAHSEGSVVSGGSDSDAFGEYGVVSGGYSNRTEGAYATVSGGAENVAGDAATAFASVSGGTCNLAASAASPYVGFCLLPAPDGAPSVSGGHQNFASGAAAAIAGGSGNAASGQAAAVGGGSARSAAGTADWRAGSLFEDF